MNDEEAIETISSNEWREMHAEANDIFDDRPTLRSPLPPPPSTPPSTRRTWSTLFHAAAGFLDAVGKAVSQLEQYGKRRRPAPRVAVRGRGAALP